MADPIKMGDLWAAFGKPKAPLDMFGTLESQYGLPRGYLGQTYQIESGGNPYAQNPNSSAGGGFQFIDSTARQYGLTDKSNLGASADAAARLARDNAAQLRRVLGREPTAAELYLAHQQGGGGASALLANPNAPAVDIVGADAVRLNGGNANMTAGEFANLWLGKFGNTPMPTNTGGGGMAGGNVTMSTMGGQQEQAPSIWNNLFGGALADPDKRARLAIALEGMTLNPNQALIQTQAEGIKSRADEKKAATEINRTAAWLRSQGRDDLAAAVESGALGGRDAAGIAMQPAQSNVPASFQALDLQAQAAGLKPGTPEYQKFMMTGGAADTGVPAAFAALDAQAQAAGFVPGSQEYKDFMATRGAGLVAESKAIGTAQGEAKASLESMSAKMPGLETVVSELNDLADRATYTLAGQAWDMSAKQLGLGPSDAAIARAEYIAKVDNQVLPLLRDTFGAAFTVKEGETLRATLGDPDKSPQEKKAVLNAFIEQKKRDIEALSRQVKPSNETSTGKKSGNTRLKFNAETGAFE